MATSLVMGSAAHSMLKDRAFEQSWNALYEECPWATPCQSFGFVNTWYRTYQDRFDPVIVCEARTDGELVGLLTMAAQKVSGRLVVAGSHQAEYQVWLASPRDGNWFIEGALRRLRTEFPRCSFRFQYLPPLTPKEWITGDPHWGWYCKLESRPRPILSFRNGNHLVEHILRKRQLRNAQNRLKELGGVDFEQVNDSLELAQIFDEIIGYYDFRQGAIHDSLPFKKDPLKRTFHLALMEVPNLLHVTVLRAGKSMLAAHLGLSGKGQVYLGIPAHSPFYARYSPGVLHLLMLAKNLKEQGYSALDLTPGGAPWKERFTTDHEEAHVLTIFSTLGQVVKDKLTVTSKALAKPALRWLGLSPDVVKTFLARVRRSRVAGIWLVPLGRMRHGSKRRVYRFTCKDVSKLDHTNLMRKDCVEDLLAFRPMGGLGTTKKFLSRWLTNCERGYHVYTRVEEGILLHLGWLIGPQELGASSDIGKGFSFAPGSTILCEFYTDHRAGRHGLEEACLRQMLYDAANMPGAERIYVVVDSDGDPFRKVVERVEFASEVKFETNRHGRPF